MELLSVAHFFKLLAIEFMRKKFSKERKLNSKGKSGRADTTLALPEGYSTLLDLSEKYGYAKDYVGWLSRTGRIEAIRHGRYGQWYASEDSLKDYISSIASASEQRYSVRSKSSVSSTPQDVVAELAVFNPKPISFGDEDKVLSTEEIVPSEPTARQKDFPILPSIESQNRGSTISEKEIGTEVFEPIEFSEPHVMTAEPKTRPVVPPSVFQKTETVPFIVPSLPRQSSQSQVEANKSSLSAENSETSKKQLAKRINAVLTASMLLGGIFIFLYLWPFLPSSFHDSIRSAGNGFKSPLSFIWNKFKGFGEPIYITIISGGSGKGEQGESGVPGAPGRPGGVGATVIREVRVTQDLTPEQINNIYGQIGTANSRIDALSSQILSLSSSISSIQPNTISPIFQLPPTNTIGIGPITLNPNKVETVTLTVSGTATIADLVVSSNLEVAAGYASASKYFGGGLADCDTDSTAKLLWDETTGKFSCGTDQNTGGGGGGGTLQIRELGVFDEPTAATISFEPGHFALTSSGSSDDVVVKLDWTNGPASRTFDETISGFWEFQSGASFSSDI